MPAVACAATAAHLLPIEAKADREARALFMVTDLWHDTAQQAINAENFANMM